MYKLPKNIEGRLLSEDVPCETIELIENRIPFFQDEKVYFYIYETRINIIIFADNKISSLVDIYSIMKGTNDFQSILIPRDIITTYIK